MAAKEPKSALAWQVTRIRGEDADITTDFVDDEPPVQGMEALGLHMGIHSVALMSAWPSKSCTARRSAPPSSRWVAKEWLRCAARGAPYARQQGVFLTIFQMYWRLRPLPERSRKVAALGRKVVTPEG